jgi:hypothetical protein
VLHDDGLEIDVLLAGLAEDFGDDADRRLVARRGIA